MASGDQQRQLAYELTRQSELMAYLACRLETSPAGFSEYELMEACRSEGWLGFEFLSYERRLFCSHFLLFNALYQLRERFWLLDEGVLEISALQIILRPAVADQAALALNDRLSEYYLNLGHYFGTDEAEVRRLLTSFWQAFAGQDTRREALAVLGLEDPVSLEEVRMTYRRLAMRTHPDRGGDPVQFQQVQAAAAALLRRQF